VSLAQSVLLVSGKKFWVLNSPTWTWEFNLITKRWNERSSLFGGLQSQYPCRDRAITPSAGTPNAAN
jgi:hypothetical protein